LPISKASIKNLRVTEDIYDYSTKEKETVCCTFEENTFIVLKVVINN
jgi:hypothetical protein